MITSNDVAVRGNLAARFQEFRDSIKRDHLLWVLLALGPIFALFCIIRVYPILETIRLSFYRYHPTQRNRPFVGVGLRNIPDELMEAAELDGATPWQRLIYIVIPMMKPIILFTVIIATIIFFNVFAPVYVLTASAQGAPAYDFKVVIGEIYQNAFVFYRMGYAGAQSVVLLLFVLTLLFVQFPLFRYKAQR